MKLVNVCFHGIGEPQRQLEPGEDQFWVEPAQFEELVDAVAVRDDVVLSFDDGNASDVSRALPELRKRRLNASFFVVARRIGEPGSLARDDLRTLVAEGMTIGSHGSQHRAWPTLDETALHEELDDARTAIAEAAGTSVDTAACPLGAYDRRVLRRLRERDFARVYTVDRQAARPEAWLQPRYVVRRTDTGDTVARWGREPLHYGLLWSAKSVAKRWR